METSMGCIFPWLLRVATMALAGKVRAAPSEPLLQPLLSRTPAAKPKARRKPKDAKKDRC